MDYFSGVYRLPQNTLMARKIKEALRKENKEHLNTCQLCAFSIEVRLILMKFFYKIKALACRQHQYV